ncbi:hypothetical protein RhiirA4_492142 [Rhizophagus irregularis]|uniref:Uncharacterized protein n=1 Tax=Rhizophagus irregularis TaxID=588596 RepID=A0A2I1HWY9_9GLOM|nr:hypothetical protein RhiirA4_492142 [Rhizophagus irregularis]
MLNNNGKFSPRTSRSQRCASFIVLASQTILRYQCSRLSLASIKELKEDSSKTILKHLTTELNARLKAIPISGNEALKSQYIC